MVYWRRTTLGTWRIVLTRARTWDLTFNGQVVATHEWPRAHTEAVACHKTGVAAWDKAGRGPWTPSLALGLWDRGAEWAAPSLVPPERDPEPAAPLQSGSVFGRIGRALGFMA